MKHSEKSVFQKVLNYTIVIYEIFEYNVYSTIYFHRSDTEAELNLVKSLAEKDGVYACVICTHFSEGSKGAKELAEAVAAACKAPNNFKYLYDLKVKVLNYFHIIVIIIMHIVPFRLKIIAEMEI